MMKRDTIKRMAVKGVMAYIAIFSLVLMVAMPALALMASSVGTREIQDHSIRSRDLRNESVTTDRIAPRAVRRGKIAKRAIRNEHVNSISDSKISHPTRTGYLTIPAAALIPATELYQYSKGSRLSMEAGSGYFDAPVYLPQGAVMTKFRYYHLDHLSPDYTNARLYRVSHTMNSLSLAFTFDSVNAFKWQPMTDTSIENATINNSAYGYYVRVYLSGPNNESIPHHLQAGNIVIDYTYKSPGS